MRTGRLSTGILILGFFVLSLNISAAAYYTRSAPPCFVPANITVPVGKERTVKLKNQADQNFTVGGFDTSVIAVTVDKPTRNITLTGLTPGETILIAVNAEGLFVAARVIVKQLAGKIPGDINAEVTGNPARRDTLIQAAAAAVEKAILLEPRAKLSIDEENILAPVTLGQDELSNVRVPVEISGPGYLTLKTLVAVSVYNHPITMKDDEVLIISNNPETVDRAGILFDGTIKKNTAVRLMYYHKNVGEKPLHFVVTLMNKGDSPVKLCAFSGTATANPDGLLAGHQSTMMFLDNLRSINSIIMVIPPHAFANLFDQVVYPGRVTTGIFKLLPLQGGDIAYEIKAQNGTPGKLSILPKIEPAVRNFQVSGTFIAPNVDLYQVYDTKENYASINIGDTPVFKSIEEQEVLKGNYGVMYRIHLSLKNDLVNTTEPVRLYYASGGGVARGVFLVNGSLTDTKLVGGNIPEEEIYATYLNPQQTKELVVTTIPQAGSFYPTTLEVWGSSRDTQQLPEEISRVNP